MKPTYKISVQRFTDGATATIARGDGTFVYEATRATAERAALAALNGASIAWVPGTRQASHRGQAIELVWGQS